MDYEGYNQALNQDRVKSLQQILERQTSAPIALKKAQEIGESLIVFFEALAEDLSEPTDPADTKVEHGQERT